MQPADFSAILSLLGQIPLVGIFIWYTLQRDKHYAALLREMQQEFIRVQAQFLQQLREERALDRDTLRAIGAQVHDLERNLISDARIKTVKGDK